MCDIKFTLIGISDGDKPYLHPKAFELIKRTKVFSGGRRHHEIMKEHLPEDAVWIDITVPLKNVFKEYEGHDEITVFASGDPLFYGYASTLRREFKNAEIEVYPTFNSLQMLAHRMLIPYQDMINVSLTGRPWKNLDDALINGYALIGILTDKVKNPNAIAARMLDYGYDNYEMTVGCRLGNDTEEKIHIIKPLEAVETPFSNPNCVILRQIKPRKRYFGIPESEFYHLDERKNMITKMPVRLISLSMLDLNQRTSFWDIGFCTGSISIEARLQFSNLDITAFEIREESRGLIESNSRKFGAPGINYIIGDFLEINLSEFRRPDAVFIGGHGGKLMQMMKRLKEVMSPGCVIVFNSVSSESCDLFRQAAAATGKRIVEEHDITLDRHNPIKILKAQ